MTKSKALTTPDGQMVHILHTDDYTSLENVLRKNRNISDPKFFSPSLSDLHDPYLMPDMEKAIERILQAQEKKERVVIFGDYDVDGVSSTAILVRFFTEIGIEVSYRLPHRVYDGYGLKNYFFTELAEKNVKLVITVDCGTRDIEPIHYAESLGIDVIVTDHHAVPEIIPEKVVALLNPKRKDSLYPFPNLAGAGVAFKLLHALILAMKEIGLCHRDEGSDPEKQKEIPKNDWIASCLAMTEAWKVESTLTNYIDFASLGTVADCMPLTGENRTITALGLKQMRNSESSALRRFFEKNETESEGNADVIGFQLGPRINAAGRMDSALKALHWLLATEDRVDDWLLEVESLNTKRQEEVKKYTEDALMNVDTSLPILFYTHDHIEHGLIGLVAGRLTEAYGKPSIVLCKQHEPKRDEVQKREYEEEIVRNLLEKGGGMSETSDGGLVVLENSEAPIPPTPLSQGGGRHLVASCRSPEWCNLVELLDECKEYFVRYGWHRQAAGFTIEARRLQDFQEYIKARFSEKYDSTNLPKKTLKVECSLHREDISLSSLDMIDRFRPFGIGNMKPLFLLEDITIAETRTLWKEGNHLSMIFVEIPNIKCLLWNYKQLFPLEKDGTLSSWDIVSVIVSLERNIWNGKERLQMMMKNIIL